MPPTILCEITTVVLVVNCFPLGTDNSAVLGRCPFYYSVFLSEVNEFFPG